MADYPNLIHGVPVSLRLVNKDGTHYDEDTGEPVGKVRRTVNVTVDGQPSFKRANYSVVVDGKKTEADGYVLFRILDLNLAGINIEEEDQIVQYGEDDGLVILNVYVIALTYCAHYPEFGGATMVKAWYSKKTPVKHK